MQPTARRGSVARLIISLMILALTVWVFFNRDVAIDQLSVWQYKPSTEIAAIASRASMNDHGRFLFYASQPKVEAREAFNQHCRQHAEKTAILGCYSQRRIYLYDITDPRLDGIKEVTAAHEMLHAAYERLSHQEKQRVNALIESAAETINNQTIERKLALYDQSEPGERLNELHSMLGSEVKDLSPELESYYAQYFTNRLTLVALSEKYEQVFAELEQRQKQLVDELNALAGKINIDNQAYIAQFSRLQEDIETFNTRAEDGGFSSQAEFNSERSRLISRQSQLTVARDAVVALINEYETKRAELDALNGTATGLQNSIDSTSLPEVPSL